MILPIRVLVIDDCPALGRTMARVLRHHDVTCVTSVRLALVLMVTQGLRYDAILCDMQMPEMNGQDFFDTLSVMLPDEARRVIFMTGHSSTAPFLRSVANACLEKPFTSDALLTAIAGVCGSTAIAS
jgi:CheY-like chemotaxis protein